MLSRPPGRKHAPGPVGATGSFLKSANTGLRKHMPQSMQEDPMISVLRGLADAPRSLPELMKQVGLAPSELAPLLDQLESMRMVRRQEEAGRFVFSIEAEGVAMLEAAA